MNLKTKFSIAFGIITLLPMIMMILLFMIIGHIQINNVKSDYGIEKVRLESILNVTKMYNDITDNDYKIIKKNLDVDKDKFEDVEYLETINQELIKEFSFLIVLKDEKILIDGSDTDGDLVAALSKETKFYSVSDNYEENIYLYGDYKYLVKSIRFEFNDGTEGNIYLVTKIGNLMPQIKRMIIEIMMGMILIVILTGIILTVWLMRGILLPLCELEAAVKNIAEGELDFEIKKRNDDEIGVLYDEFENMRIKLKEAAEARVRDEEESKELISNISHDLKTPITSIKGYVEGIMDGVADTPEKMDKYIKTIYNKTNDMNTLIGELTVYSKIDTNRLPYNFRKVNVNAYFSDCVDEIYTELEAKGIELQYFNYTDKDTVIIADPEQFKRVINNIISNAVKYMGKDNGMINIRIKDVKDYISIEIEDNGKGIDEKDLSRIFDRFYRTDSSRNSKQGGTGLGLAISKKIIEMHSGRIWATSKVDVGTTMHIMIKKFYEIGGEVYE